MKAFITGIAGFAGTHLTEHLLAAGDEVSGASLSGKWPPGPEIPADVRDRVSLIAWDIAADTLPLDALTRFAPDAIYHLAAISKAADCGQHEPTQVAIDTNVGGTEQVLKLAQALPSQPKVVFISSSYVYGPTNDLKPIAESSLVAPSGGYGRTKQMAEERVQAFVQQGGNAVIARSFQHAGPRQLPRFMLAEWCEQFANSTSSPIVIQNRGSYIDLTDVRDVVRAYRLLALQGTAGEAYNVGSGVALRSGEIFDTLRQLVDPNRASDAKADVTKYSAIADIAKIERDLGWQPEISLEQTLRDTYDWFREQATAS
ncbi:MAG TPA: NAD(P)-dependent oxidoreductase [Pirellulaceae bacterium]|nr:NAD(P)-dependent oxidoreductase [Pirellulaceae bacterium]